MDHLKLSTLISEEEINKRIADMGASLTDRFRGQEIVAICVLKGSFMFYADLIRHLDTEVVCEFFGVSSYEGNKTSGIVRMNLDLMTSIEGKHVLLIEDIVDTGLTMRYLQENLRERQPESLTTATLLHKPAAKKVDCDLDHVGFEIGNDFVVGFGLDYMNHFRNLPYIAQIQNFN